MDLSRINGLLFRSALSIFLFCLLYNVALYLLIKSPEYKELKSARIIGTNDTHIFIEIIWSVKNVAYLPFTMALSEVSVYDNDTVIGGVKADEKHLVTPLKESRLKTTASIPRTTFQSLMTNQIDSYSFHLIGTAFGRVLFIKKKFPFNQFIPINISQLMRGFMLESCKNYISIEKVSFISERGFQYMDCIINFQNRSKIELNFREFDGSVQVNKRSNGYSTAFVPVRFSSNQAVNSSTIRFALDSLIDSKEVNHFIINGSFKVGLWGRLYTVPVEMIGTNQSDAPIQLR